MSQYYPINPAVGGRCTKPAIEQARVHRAAAWRLGLTRVAASGQQSISGQQNRPRWFCVRGEPPEKVFKKKKRSLENLGSHFFSLSFRARRFPRPHQLSSYLQQHENVVSGQFLCCDCCDVTLAQLLQPVLHDDPSSRMLDPKPWVWGQTPSVVSATKPRIRVRRQRRPAEQQRWREPRGEQMALGENTAAGALSFIYGS